MKQWKKRGEIQADPPFAGWAEADSAVSLRGVTKGYGDFLLDHVDLEIPKGSIVGLVGENGAGKTTMLKAILQMISLDEGEILVEGSRRKVQEGFWKNDLGVVLFGFSSFASMNARQLGRCLEKLYDRWDRALYEEFLRRFHIDPKKKIGQYSKGMERKLDLAAALSHGAKLLVLDEATSGLDPLVRDEILGILMEFIQNEEHTVLFSTHIISDLEKVADYVAFLHRGRLVFFREKDALLEDYGIYRCSQKEYEALEPSFAADVRKSQFEYQVLVKNRKECMRLHPKLPVEKASLEEILIGTLRGKEE